MLVHDRRKNLYRWANVSPVTTGLMGIRSRSVALLSALVMALLVSGCSSLAQNHAAPVSARVQPPSKKIQVHQVEAGETLFREEDAAVSVYLIEGGEADVWAAGDGREPKVATFRRNELVDCKAILRDARSRSIIRAVGPLKVLKIDADVLLRMVADSPRAALAVMREHRRARIVGEIL